MCAQVQERMYTHINMHRYMVEHRPLCAHTCKHTSKDTYKETYKDTYARQREGERRRSA